MEMTMSSLVRTREVDRENIAKEEAAKLRNEFAEAMRQRLAALDKAEKEAMNRVRQNQKDMERRMAEWHQEATRQIDETARKQNIRAQQLRAEELRLERLKLMVNHEWDTPLALKDEDRRKSVDRQNDVLALEDVNSANVQWHAKKAANLEVVQETLKNKLKSMEDKYALSQKAIADVEAEKEGMTKRLVSVDRHLEEAKRKQEQQSKTISKKEQWESVTKAELAKLKFEVDSAQRETGRLKVALEDLEISSQRDRANVKSQLNVLQTDHTWALEEISSLRSKNRASASAQRVASKLEAELRNLKEEHEQLQAEMNSAQIRSPVDWGALKASLRGEVATRQN